MMKKLIYLLTAGILSICLTGCTGKSGSSADESDSTQSVQDNFSFHFNETGYPGTYRFTDGKGVVCTIVLKADYTFTAESSKVDGIRTGKWAVYNNDCPKLSFDDTDDLLFFTFPEGKDDGMTKQAINEGVISDDGYIYALSIYYDAKKNDKRLPIRKLN